MLTIIGLFIGCIITGAEAGLAADDLNDYCNDNPYNTDNNKACHHLLGIYRLLISITVSFTHNSMTTTVWLLLLLAVDILCGMHCICHGFDHLGYCLCLQWMEFKGPSTEGSWTVQPAEAGPMLWSKTEFYSSLLHTITTIIYIMYFEIHKLHSHVVIQLLV